MGMQSKQVKLNTVFKLQWWHIIRMIQIVAFTVLEENNSASAIVMQIEESLYCQYQGYKNRVEFSNAIMVDQVKNPRDQRLYYNVNKWEERANLTFFVTSVKTLPWYT